MANTKWDPLREMDLILENYNKSIGLHNITDLELLPRGDWIPRVDIAETEKHFIIKMDAPEVKKQDVNISVANRTLSIKGERMKEKEEGGKKFHRIERFYGTFCRSFKLPRSVDIECIEATFNDGILLIELPKISEQVTTKVEVRIK